MESNEIFKCNLLDTWPKSSSVNSVNLVKKICYNSVDIGLFLGDCFLLAHPVYYRQTLKPVIVLSESEYGLMPKTEPRKQIYVKQSIDENIT